jgi:lambda family phage portal protein
MIGEWVDHFVSVFAPGVAAQRALMRSRYRQTTQRAYEAARDNRRTAGWSGALSQSADKALYGDAEKTRNRVRDLVRNNAYARGAVDAIVSNIVGTGIVPRPMLEDRKRADKILAKWNAWCETADITGRLHFYEMQALALREAIEAGEALTKYIQEDKPDPIRKNSLYLELIESERLALENDATLYGRRRADGENEVRRGVELDSRGKAVAYHLYNQNPYGNSANIATPERVIAKDILHLFRQDRIGQTRGISWLAPAVMWLRDLGIYVDNEIQASTVASCFSVVIKTLDSGDSWGSLQTPDGAESTDTDGNKFERLQPGLVTHLMPGEDVVPINTQRPNATADVWVSLMLRSIAVSCGLSYELVSRDYSRTTYSANRASALEDRRRFRPFQKFVIWHYCQPIYREWFKACVLAKESGAAGMEMFPSLTEYEIAPEKWLACKWRPPGWEWVDPLKEGEADKLAVDNLFKSRGDVIESANADLAETWQELADEQDLAAELGLTLPMEKSATAMATAELSASEPEPEPANAA